jgi:GNAT superfamily N-acetyltransferase
MSVPEDQPPVSVRHVVAGEHQRLREIRLAALAADPDAFGSTYAREAAQPIDIWRELAVESERGTTRRTFVAEHGDGRWLGLAVARLDDRTPGSSTLTAMWVTPDGRGRGLAGALCAACADWAAERGCLEITLSVVTANEGAQRAYVAAGFEVRATTTWERDDGTTLLEYVMARSPR